MSVRWTWRYQYCDVGADVKRVKPNRTCSPTKWNKWQVRFKYYGSAQNFIVLEFHTGTVALRLSLANGGGNTRKVRELGILKTSPLLFPRHSCTGTVVCYYRKSMTTRGAICWTYWYSALISQILTPKSNHRLVRIDIFSVCCGILWNRWLFWVSDLF